MFIQSFTNLGKKLEPKSMLYVRGNSLKYY